MSVDLLFFSIYWQYPESFDVLLRVQSQNWKRHRNLHQFLILVKVQHRVFLRRQFYLFLKREIQHNEPFAVVQFDREVDLDMRQFVALQMEAQYFFCVASGHEKEWWQAFVLNSNGVLLFNHRNWLEILGIFNKIAVRNSDYFFQFVCKIGKL